MNRFHTARNDYTSGATYEQLCKAALDWMGVVHMLLDDPDVTEAEKAALTEDTYVVKHGIFHRSEFDVLRVAVNGLFYRTERIGERQEATEFRKRRGRES